MTDERALDLEAEIGDLHAHIERVKVLAQDLQRDKGRASARAVAVSITHAETALLWLGHTQALYRNGN